jgi:hypothetical protein
VTGGANAQLLQFMRLLKGQSEIVLVRSIVRGDEDHKAFHDLCVRTFRKDLEADVMTFAPLEGEHDIELDQAASNAPTYSGRVSPTPRHPTRSTATQQDEILERPRLDLGMCGRQSAPDVIRDTNTSECLEMRAATERPLLRTRAHLATDTSPVQGLPAEQDARPFSRGFESSSLPVSASSSSSTLSKDSGSLGTVGTSVDDTPQVTSSLFRCQSRGTANHIPSQSPAESRVLHRQPSGVCIQVGHNPEDCKRGRHDAHERSIHVVDSNQRFDFTTLFGV